MPKISFDEALGAFCKVIKDAGCEFLLADGVFVRDIAGRLQLVVPQEKVAAVDRASLSARLFERLGSYLQTPPDGLIRDIDSAAVLERRPALPERVFVDGDALIVRVIDQRASGQDWLSRPVEPSGEVPPRLVFWSLKGGVGRTTALVAFAASLARAGKNVLVVDLDLEAPGVGDLLLSPTEKPLFGVLDYLAEEGVENISTVELLPDLVATSSLVQGQGLLDVCPAAGRRTIESPQNYMAKLFRAYPPARGSDGEYRSFADRIRVLLAQLEKLKRYDAVLVDARAGLNESTAAALLALGGDVLMFGHETPQTFAGYGYAFAHFSRFVINGDSEWRLRLKMVHAKAPASTDGQQRFRDESFDLMSEWLYDSEGDFAFSMDDPDAPHYPWLILDDSNYRAFDPINDPHLLEGSIFHATFGDFIQRARARMRLDAA